MPQRAQVGVDPGQLLVDLGQLGLGGAHEPRVGGDCILDPANRAGEFVLELVAHHLHQAFFQFGRTRVELVAGRPALVRQDEESQSSQDTSGENAGYIDGRRRSSRHDQRPKPNRPGFGHGHPGHSIAHRERDFAGVAIGVVAVDFLLRPLGD